MLVCLLVFDGCGVGRATDPPHRDVDGGVDILSLRYATPE